VVLLAIVIAIILKLFLQALLPVSVPINKSGINLFNFMSKRSYVPFQFGLDIIVPLVKDKNGDVCSSDNCRGNTINPLMFKVFQQCLMV